MNTNGLHASRIPHEYYLGDLPGTLQYNKKPSNIVEIQYENYDSNETCGYELCEHSLENLKRVTPLTQKDQHYKILLMMKRVDSNGVIWLKAALRNTSTEGIALLTSTNSEYAITNGGNKSVKTVDGSWYVGHYRMTAPIVFWRELKNRLLY